MISLMNSSRSSPNRPGPPGSPAAGRSLRRMEGRRRCHLWGRGCPCPESRTFAMPHGGAEAASPVGSGLPMPREPDVRSGHPALRSLGCRLRCAILAALVCIRRLSGHGQPRPCKPFSKCSVQPVYQLAAGNPDLALTHWHRGGSRRGCRRSSPLAGPAPPSFPDRSIWPCRRG